MVKMKQFSILGLVFSSFRSLQNMKLTCGQRRVEFLDLKETEFHSSNLSLYLVAMGNAASFSNKISAFYQVPAALSWSWQALCGLSWLLGKLLLPDLPVFFIYLFILCQKHYSAFISPLPCCLLSQLNWSSGNTVKTSVWFHLRDSI